MKKSKSRETEIIQYFSKEKIEEFRHMSARARLQWLEDTNAMAKWRKRKASIDDVDSYRHEKDTRKNAVPVGLASYDTSKPKPKKYEYDPHLDPQLVWTGKAEHTSFEVPTVSLHIHERTNKVTFAEALSI